MRNKLILFFQFFSFVFTMTYKAVASYLAEQKLYTRCASFISMPAVVLSLVPSAMKTVYDSAVSFQPQRYKHKLAFDS